MIGKIYERTLVSELLPYLDFPETLEFPKVILGNRSGNCCRYSKKYPGT